ncbi:MAG: ABC transporter permease [Anaerolineae bacterium]
MKAVAPSPALIRQAARVWRLNAQPIARRQARVNRHLTAGMLLLLPLLIGALVSAFWTPYPPDQIQVGPRLAAPSPAHPFGTDEFGRDLLSRVMAGAGIAVRMALGGVAISAVIGTGLGLVAGYHGRWIDGLASRLMDAWLGFPGLLLAIVVVARLGPSLTNAVIALGVLEIPVFFRLVRGTTLSTKGALFVEAAQAVGCTNGRILLRHILPAIQSSLIVLCTVRMGILLLAGGSLSFIGLGAQPPTPEWGLLLASGRRFLNQAWWLSAFPGLAITLSVLGFNLLGDGLRDRLDPHSTS